jgi:NAD(P)-dependent dehydrogenase (short-subunit alcohol dehydrogenase family)
MNLPGTDIQKHSQGRLEMSSEEGARTALVTGGTDGIGKEIARGLARAGCRIVVVGRNHQKGSGAAAEIQRTSGNPNVEFLQADLSLMSEAKRVTREIASRWSGLKYLVHSAGIVSNRWALTAEGVESNLAINYLSRFVLTQGLLPLLSEAGEKADAARILIINGAARNGAIFFDDISLTSNFGFLRMVGQSCRVNDVFTIEQARRLAGAGEPRVTINCLKMGVVKTNIRKSPNFPRWMKVLVPLIMDPLLGMTAEQAASPALKLLLSREYEAITGKLFLMIRKFKQIQPDVRAINPEIGRRLWDLTEQMTVRISGAPENPASSVAELELKGENQ